MYDKSFFIYERRFSMHVERFFIYVKRFFIHENRFSMYFKCFSMYLKPALYILKRDFDMNLRVIFYLSRTKRLGEAYHSAEMFGR